MRPTRGGKQPMFPTFRLPTPVTNDGKLGKISGERQQHKHIGKHWHPWGSIWCLDANSCLLRKLL